ncbi:MAG: hypothetical protein JKP98_14970 [Rhodobacteraceae bacterium]|jgi:uncharacterized protein YigA (DUF484 family)|nr:hypothetical protein [Paracoccaceae bacterium]MBL4557912.1 hypothetical protein [Paracoccaceae bacterium]HBG97473.1 hypothetical protein [Paracoccaceae bacterium]
MGLKKLAAKLSGYQDRLDAGKAPKIEIRHVRKVLEKLLKKEQELVERLDAADDPKERASLERKLRVAREHIARAQWLLQELSGKAAAGA